MEPFYRTTSARRYHNAVANGFWSRYLDADDHEFLDYVRRTGSANSSLPGREAVLIEELEFWHLPYSLAPGIERHIGRRPRELPEETAEARALRQARTSAWHARRMIKEQERKIAAVELEREQREWKEANAKRKRQQIISDVEWEAAAPHRNFGTTVNRHYVPQWKLDEIAQAKTERKVRKILETSSPKWALTERRERLAKDAARIEADRRAAKLEEETRFEVGARLLDEWVEKRKQAAAERLLEEARKTVELAERVERETITAPTTYDPETLKVAIMSMLSRTAPYVWNGYALMRALGCTNEDLMNRCMKSLAAEGKLQPADRGNGWG